MSLQHLIVALVVVVCGVCAAWALMPASMRRALATLALRAPGPAALRHALQRAVHAAPGCGCSGCDHATPAKQQTVQFRPRRSR